MHPLAMIPLDPVAHARTPSGWRTCVRGVCSVGSPCQGQRIDSWSSNGASRESGSFDGGRGRDEHVNRPAMVPLDPVASTHTPSGWRTCVRGVCSVGSPCQGQRIDSWSSNGASRESGSFDGGRGRDEHVNRPAMVPLDPVASTHTPSGWRTCVRGVCSVGSPCQGQRIDSWSSNGASRESGSFN